MPATPAIGYLLKDRIGEVTEFIDALERVMDGHTVVDPEVVRQMLSRRRDPLTRLNPLEREVLGLTAEGRSNAAIARELVVTGAALAKHIGSLLTKLDLPLTRTLTDGFVRCSPISWLTATARGARAG